MYPVLALEPGMGQAGHGAHGVETVAGCCYQHLAIRRLHGKAQDISGPVSYMAVPAGAETGAV